MLNKMVKKKEIKEETSKALVLRTANDIPKALEMVLEKIAELKKGQPKQPPTTQELTGFGRIESIDSVESLLKAASMVSAKKEAYDKEVKLFISECKKRDLPPVKIPQFKLNGSTEKQWKEHIHARIFTVANKDQLAKLNQIKVKLEANLSAEDKLAKDLKDIEEILTS